MHLADRIEKRRFVGREFLLWLWFESELFEGTLATKEQGSFGLWVDRQILLSVGKEATRIKGTQPAAAREAKESLLRGKLPEVCGLTLSWRERESTFVLKGEQLAISALVLPTVLGKEEEEAPRVDRPPTPPRRKKRPTDADAQKAAESDEEHEAFYERMQLTREIEALVEALYRDFIALRLGPAWSATVVPALRAWAGGDALDADAYREERQRALKGTDARRDRTKRSSSTRG